MNKLLPLAALFAFGVAAGPALAESPLADALENGRREAALALIEQGADVNAAQGDGTTPLHWAAYQLDSELVERLIARGASANTQNRYGASPLGEAAKAAHAAIVALLLKGGANVAATNADGETVLMLAARTGSTEVASALLAAGADVNAREAWRDQTALMWAAEGAFPGLVDLLIEHGADVRARAATNDWGSQITSEPRAQYRPTGGLTPLLYAARSGCTECVAAILAAGEAVDRPTPDGVTALMLAIDNYEFDTAKALLEAGANPHLSDWWGRTALYLAVDLKSYVPRGGAAHPRSTSTTGMDLVKALLAAGVEVNSQLNFHRPGRGGNTARFVDDMLTTGATPLLRAAIMHDDEAMRALLAANAQVDLPNVMGVTPLMAAAGIGVREPGFGANRAPDFASKEIESEIIASLDILLDAGADVNAAITDIQSRTARIARASSMTDRQGQTALHSAAGRGWPNVVAHLLQRGANPALKDMQGRTPLDLATTPVQGRAVPNSERIAELLTRGGAQPNWRHRGPGGNGHHRLPGGRSGRRSHTSGKSHRDPRTRSRGSLPGNGSLTDLYRFGTRHRRLYPGSADPGAAMVKDGVQSLLGIPVHHTVVFDSGNLDETDMVDSPGAGKRCAAAGVVRSLRPEGLVRRIPSLVGAELGISVTSDIPLDLVPDMVELLPTLSPRQVLTVPITAPDYGRAEQKSQVADPERVRAAMVSLVKLSPEEAAYRLGLDDRARCATGRPLQAAADNR